MAFLVSLFSGVLYLGGLIVGGNLTFQNGLGLTIKTPNSNSPWAYIREGLLSEEYLRLRFGGLIFERAYFWEGLLSEFYGITYDLCSKQRRPMNIGMTNQPFHVVQLMYDH